MSSKKRKSLRRDERRAIVARRYLQGVFQSDIAEEVGVTQSTVSKDLKAIQEQWRTSSLMDFGEAKQRELERIDALEEQAWKAWFRSCEKRTRTDNRVKGIQAKPEEYEVDDEGKLVRKKSKVYPLEVDTKTVVYQRDGDPRWLATIQRCIQLRIKLLALDEVRPEDDESALEEFVEALAASAVAAWDGVEEPDWEDDDEVEDDELAGEGEE